MSPARTVAFSALIALAVLLGGGIMLGAVGPGIEIRAQDQLRAGTDSATLGPDAHRIEQTFRAEQAGLSTVAVQLAAINTLPTDGTFRLWAADSAGPPILSLPLPAGDFSGNPYLAFHFVPLADSAGRTYRFEIATTEPLAAGLALQVAPYDAYSAGAVGLDGVPQSGDLTFRTYYTYSIAAFVADCIHALTDHSGSILTSLLFLLLPGFALSTALADWPPAQRLIAAPALTLLIWPVLLVVLWTVGRGPAAGWLLGAAAWTLSGLSAAFLLLRVGRTKLSAAAKGIAIPPRFTPSAYGTALVALLGITLASRWVTIRDLVAGMGLDAYHHTLVTQLLLDQGGVPRNYAPYAPLASFTYHFGFHALAAALGRLTPTAWPVAQLMPLAGQLATALPVLTLALFGARVLGNRWVGLVAGGLAGTVAIFPAFYVNWSRYTQGLGLALLPVAWVLLLDALCPVQQWRVGMAPLRGVRRSGGRTAGAPLALAAGAAAGLFLTHYRIAGLFASYAVLLVLGIAGRVAREPAGTARGRALGTLAQHGLAVTAGTAGLLLPWLLNLRANFTTRFAGAADASNAPYYDWRFMLGGGEGQLAYWSSGLLLALAALGLLRCLWRRDWPAVALVVWFAGHLLWSNPTAIHLPGAGYIDTVTVVTSGFLPVCLLAAYPLVSVGGWLLGLRRLPGGAAPSPAWQPAVAGILAGAGLLVALGGAVRLLPILDVRPYVTPADLAAMQWLAGHTPAGTLIAGNGFGQQWGPEAVQGSDAGVWTPLLAGRPSTLPPIPAYNERPVSPAYIPQAITIVRDTQAILGPADSADALKGWADLRAAGVGYLFVGARGGILDPAVLLARPDQVQVAFHQDDTWVFAIRPAR